MKAAMPVLSNSKHEQFALAIAKGVSASRSLHFGRVLGVWRQAVCCPFA